MTIPTITFLVGLALIIVAALGGGIEIKEVKIPKLTPIPRALSFVIGCVLVFLPELFDPQRGNTADTPPPPLVPPALSPRPTGASPPGPEAPTPLKRSIWNQDGSRLYLEVEGAARKLHYDQPNEAMMRAGAKPGGPFFEGTRAGLTYRGTAYAYSTGCSALGYDVSGDISDDEQKITLRGKAPRRNAACVKIGDQDEVLVLSYRGTSGN